MYSKILLPIDDTDEASWEKALPLALEEAKSHGAELSVVTVIPEILRLPNLPENYGEGDTHHGSSRQRLPRDPQGGARHPGRSHYHRLRQGRLPRLPLRAQCVARGPPRQLFGAGPSRVRGLYR